MFAHYIRRHPSIIHCLLSPRSTRLFLSLRRRSQCIEGCAERQWKLHQNWPRTFRFVSCPRRMAAVVVRLSASIRWLGFVADELGRNALRLRKRGWLDAADSSEQGNGGSAPLAVVTGATGTLGQAICNQLASDGFDLVVVSRNIARSEDVSWSMRAHGRQTHSLELDLRNVDSIHSFRDELKELGRRIDVLVNNAAVSGSEDNFLVNYVRTALLTNSLLSIPSVAPRRVVNVSSSAHLKATEQDLFLGDVQTSSRSYAASKLALLLYSSRLRSNGIEVVDVHPGIIWSPLLQETLPNRFLRGILGRFQGVLLGSAADGAELVKVAAVARSPATYLTPNGPARVSALARNPALRNQLQCIWQEQTRYCSVKAQ